MHKKLLRLGSLIILIGVLILISPLGVQADSSGPNYPWLGVNLAGVGTVAWTTPVNIYADDAAYASVTLNENDISNYLQGTDFRFNIPPEASIAGIEVAFERYSPGNNPRVRDQVVSLVKGGTIIAVNKATAGNWPQAPNLTTYGSATDLWGETWTPADINSAGFGAVLAAVNPNNQIRTAYVDYMRITVTYKLNSTTSVDCGDGTPVVTIGESITCEASVSSSGGVSTPTGTISWTTDAAGSFTPPTCALTGTGGTGVCIVSYTPSSAGDGSHLITAMYPGDANYIGSSGSQTVTISANQPPVIVSNGGGDTAAISIPENTTAVTTVVATDPESGSLIYSIIGGADAAKFTIGSSSGILSFISPPNFEAPTDIGLNNVYDVIVQVADPGMLTDNQVIAVTVLNANDAPTIIESDPQTVNMSEDSSPTPFNLTLHAADPDPGTTLTWSILNQASNGTAAASGTGNSIAISYTSFTNYNGPDAFTVQVSDGGGLTDTIVVQVNIEPVLDNYYVDNTQGDASDANPGSNPALPLLTISRGAAIARAGDYVFVLAGTYQETVTLDSYSGAPGFPITFQANEGVTVKGDGNVSTGSAFRIFQQRYIVIDGFNIANTAYKGIYAVFADHLVISNNQISGAGYPSYDQHRQGIHLYATTNSVITGNVTRENSCIGIRLTHSSNNNTVSNNTSYGNFSPAGGSEDAAGIELDDSDNNLIIHNITYGNDDSGINLALTVGDGSNNNQIIGNLSYGNGDHGIDNNNSSGQIIVGNTVHGNYTSGINLELNSGGATLANNIIADNGLNPAIGKPGNINVDNSSVGGTSLDYNLYFRSGGLLQIRWDSVSYGTLEAFQSAFPAFEAHGLESDPLFVNPVSPVAARPAVAASGNYSLMASSPAIDSANSAAPYQPVYDILGVGRFDDPDVTNTGAGPRLYDDRGAFERHPSSEPFSYYIYLPTITK